MQTYLQNTSLSVWSLCRWQIRVPCFSHWSHVIVLCDTRSLGEMRGWLGRRGWGGQRGWSWQSNRFPRFELTINPCSGNKVELHHLDTNLRRPLSTTSTVEGGAGTLLLNVSGGPVPTATCEIKPWRDERLYGWQWGNGGDGSEGRAIHNHGRNQGNLYPVSCKV